MLIENPNSGDGKNDEFMEKLKEKLTDERRGKKIRNPGSGS